MKRTFDVITSILATVARLRYAERVGMIGLRPEQPLVLYEFEGCPFCRKVREALTVLDLEAFIYPCPKGGPRFREEVKSRGGKAQFPYLLDRNRSEGKQPIWQRALGKAVGEEEVEVVY